MSTRVVGSRLALWVPGVRLLNDEEAREPFNVNVMDYGEPPIPDERRPKRWYRPEFKRSPHPENVPMPAFVLREQWRRRMAANLLALIKPADGNGIDNNDKSPRPLI
ncbi:unnamed protein product [Vitrella brassicaformis CCMP3155]|uniref:Uncharacterized protein n=1 Tax=Vitrella brassicaformis (strain CCMP3155) TaxID=1169540 RepID=A0A0G4GPR6_VITBC|nr:unnamed protein product [Vitrella brassicaformis CCMP3155]|eukprot:CEM32339.1 unnamed protein product [Vitrella brassicaformis CCMP3155]